MAQGQTLYLRTDHQRRLAHQLIDRAPTDAIVNIREATRSNDQNALMWVLISDISRAKPDGRVHTAETWKCLFMQAAGHAVQFEEGLDGRPFPVGFRSSRLTKAQMGVLLEVIYEYGARHAVKWSDPRAIEDA